MKTIIFQGAKSDKRTFYLFKQSFHVFGILWAENTVPRLIPSVGVTVISTPGSGSDQNERTDSSKLRVDSLDEVLTIGFENWMNVSLPAHSDKVASYSYFDSSLL